MKRTAFIIILVSLLLIANICYAQQSRGMKRPSDQIEMPEVVYRTGWALIIGIDKYPDLPSQFQLNYSVSDAESVAKLLEKKFGFDKKNIFVLKNEQATKSKIREKLHSFADPNMVDKEDCLFIYFSGHGQTVPLPRGAGEMGFLIPYDAKINSLDQEPNPSEYMRYCIAMNELNDAAKTIPAKHIIYVIDACYSGLVLGSYRGLKSTIPGYLVKVSKATTQQMITAGGKGEVSEDRPDLGHGVFTYKLINGLEKELADGNNDGVITGTELSTYLTTAVQEMTNGMQNPKFGRYEEGEFLFIPQKQEIPIATVDGKLLPQGTKVYVDGSPVSLPHKTSPGTHKIRLERNGYNTVETSETLNNGQMFSPNPRWVLVPPPKTDGIFQVKATPTNAEISVTSLDTGKSYDMSPSGEIEIPAGTYAVTAKRDGYTSEVKEANIVANKRTTMAFNLKPKQQVQVLATINADGLPFDARVFVDGSPVTMPYQVQPGTYGIKIERNGFKTYDNKERLSSGQVLDLNPVWIPQGVRRGISPVLALGASAVVPGLGQHLQGHKARGFVYEGVVLATGVLALFTTFQHFGAVDDYDEIRGKLLTASQSRTMINSEIKSLLKDQDDAYDKAKSTKNQALIGQILFGVAWGFNSLDAGFLIKPDQSGSGVALEIKPLSDGSMIIARSSF